MKFFDGNKIFSFMLAAAFALTLAGCGGGGGGGTAQMPDTMPDPQMECEDAGGRYNADMTCTSAEELTMEMQAAQRSAISSAIGAASDAVAAVNDDSTDAEVMAADAAIEAANAAIANAADVPAAEKAANSGRVSQIEGRLSAALESRMAAMDAAADEAQMALNAMAMKLHAGLHPFVNVNAATNRPHLGGTVTVTLSSLTGSFDTNGTVVAGGEQGERILPASGTATPAAGGWEGTDYVLTDGGVTNHAVVYRNQGPPTEAAFEVTHAGIITDGAIPSTAAGFDTFKIAGAEFASGAGRKTHEIPTNAVYVSVLGTFDGAPGEFRCTADCVSSVSSATGVSLAGTWSFIADDGAMTSRPDADYQVFGWWARDDGTSVRVSPMSLQTGPNDELSSAIGGLQGGATYVGGAAGKVAVFDPLSDVNNAGGAFTADATFTVDFGNATDGGTISATIDNFSVGGEAKDWSVAFKETILQTGAFYSNLSNGTTWTVGGQAAADSGWWAGSMYDTDAVSGVPQTVTGMFSSGYGNIGAMTGAFGADKE